MTDVKKRLYFAAPLFTQAEWQWNARLAAELRARGVEVLLPQETAAPMLNDPSQFDARKLFETNIADLDAAGVVLAVFDQADPDSGTCWECGYAYRAGYPIIGLRTDIRGGGDDPGQAVNLMLSKCCTAFIAVPQDRREDVAWVAEQVVVKLRDAAG
ncbi:MAG TPA: nucleoside 2-deoxyribosyltransferase [Pyrinomonadaceae bacterium]|jgi:nucleoside 2-deoxyribosyltransferase|nr:nucleoside 2-deoxyribosyltransferase [Pyrinomonadaceae bacterium]